MPNTPTPPPIGPAGATFSEDRRYRYRLWRAIPGRCDEDEQRWCNFLMLNPSIADEEKPDPTMTRCLNFARAWGCTHLVITNLFALVSTDPKRLKLAGDPIGPSNDAYILDAASNAALVVCAWGENGAFLSRGKDVRKLLVTNPRINPLVLRFTSKGQPEHPLYLPGSLVPRPWEQEAHA